MSRLAEKNNTYQTKTWLYAQLSNGGREVSDLHTHLLGMGDAEFWLNQVLLDDFVLPKFVGAFDDYRKDLTRCLPLVWNENKVRFYKEDEVISALKRFIDSELAKINSKEKESDCYDFLKNKWHTFQLRERLADTLTTITFEVVLSVSNLAKALGYNEGIYEKLGIDILQSYVEEKLGVFGEFNNSSPPERYFDHFLVWNARKQEFEKVYGIKVSLLRDLISVNVSSTTATPVSHRFTQTAESARAHIVNAFSMCSVQGTQANLGDLQTFRGCFTPEFFPRRYALKDSIYEQRLDILPLLLKHVLSRYESSRPAVTYVEFSIGVKDASRPWVIDILSCFSTKPSQNQTFNRVFLKAATGGKDAADVPFSWLRGFNSSVRYRFLAGFSRQTAVKRKISKRGDAIDLLYTNSWQCISDVFVEILLEKNNLSSRLFVDFEEELLKLEKNFFSPVDIKKKHTRARLADLFQNIVGLDLLGDELGYPYCPFVTDKCLKFVKKIRKDCNPRFGLRVHSGENVPAVRPNMPGYRMYCAHMFILGRSLQHLSKRLPQCSPDGKYVGLRVGHGISFAKNSESGESFAISRKSNVLMDFLESFKRNVLCNIPLEICPTSNSYLLSSNLLYVGQNSGSREHGLRKLLEKKEFKVTLATDNDGIWPLNHCAQHHACHHSLAAEYCDMITNGNIRCVADLNNLIKTGNDFRFIAAEYDQSDDDESSSNSHDASESETEDDQSNDDENSSNSHDASKSETEDDESNDDEISSNSNDAKEDRKSLKVDDIERMTFVLCNEKLLRNLKSLDPQLVYDWELLEGPNENKKVTIEGSEIHEGSKKNKKVTIEGSEMLIIVALAARSSVPSPPGVVAVTQAKMKDYIRQEELPNYDYFRGECTKILQGNELFSDHYQYSVTPVLSQTMHIFLSYRNGAECLKSVLDYVADKIINVDVHVIKKVVVSLYIPITPKEWKIEEGRNFKVPVTLNVYSSFGKNETPVLVVNKPTDLDRNMPTNLEIFFNPSFLSKRSRASESSDPHQTLSESHFYAVCPHSSAVSAILELFASFPKDEHFFPTNEDADGKESADEEVHEDHEHSPANEDAGVDLEVDLKLSDWNVQSWDAFLVNLLINEKVPQTVYRDDTESSQPTAAAIDRPSIRFEWSSTQSNKGGKNSVQNYLETYFANALKKLPSDRGWCLAFALNKFLKHYLVERQETLEPSRRSILSTVLLEDLLCVVVDKFISGRRWSYYDARQAYDVLLAVARYKEFYPDTSDLPNTINEILNDRRPYKLGNNWQKQSLTKGERPIIQKIKDSLAASSPSSTSTSSSHPSASASAFASTFSREVASASASSEAAPANSVGTSRGRKRVPATQVSVSTLPPEQISELLTSGSASGSGSASASNKRTRGLDSTPTAATRAYKRAKK